jgi:hypothetical protein
MCTPLSLRCICLLLLQTWAATSVTFEARSITLTSKPLGFNINKLGFVSKIKNDKLGLRLGDKLVKIGGEDSSGWSGKETATALKVPELPVEIEFASPRVLDVEVPGSKCTNADLPKGKNAVVYSYHMCEGDTISESWLERLQTSAGSVRNQHPDMIILLLTNIPASDINWQLHQVFDKIITIDLLKRSGLLPFYKRVKKMTSSGAICRASACGTKAYALLHLWNKCNANYDGLLYMDHDTYWLAAGANDFFEPLEFYDVAGVMEGYAYDTSKEQVLGGPAAGGGWELSTGVISFRRSAKKLIELWLAEIIKEPMTFAMLTSVDQQALMLAIQANPAYRFFPMPNRYNWRYSTIHPPTGPAAPVVLHHRDVGSTPIVDLAQRVLDTVEGHIRLGVQQVKDKLRGTPEGRSEL